MKLPGGVDKDARNPRAADLHLIVVHVLLEFGSEEIDNLAPNMSRED